MYKKEIEDVGRKLKHPSGGASCSVSCHVTQRDDDEWIDDESKEREWNGNKSPAAESEADFITRRMIIKHLYFKNL